jgi:hypothetical protein
MALESARLLSVGQAAPTGQVSALRAPTHRQRVSSDEAASTSLAPAAVEQEQRIRFDCLGRFALSQFALRRFDRCPRPSNRILG